ncbi:hypothetical protein BRC83_06665 [Halobacteriales archaeon QS_1_68_17]|nr:MAG: hypothetical protein BRC83_06665 [Halobacteriales archaeon QS_1_68_17]
MTGSPDRTPPEPDLPTDLREWMREQDAETLRALAADAERMADQADDRGTPEPDGTARTDDDGAEVAPEGWDDAEWRATVADADAPPRATVTVKEINDNRYYYYQWREGDRVKSAYIAPVAPSE